MIDKTQLNPTSLQKVRFTFDIKMCMCYTVCIECKTVIMIQVFSSSMLLVLCNLPSGSSRSLFVHDSGKLFLAVLYCVLATWLVLCLVVAQFHMDS